MFRINKKYRYLISGVIAISLSISTSSCVTVYKNSNVQNEKNRVQYVDSVAVKESLFFK